MFKLTETPTFTRTVKVLVPIDGGHEEQSFTAKFRVLPMEKLKSYDTENNADQGTAFLREVIVGLDDIAGPDGSALPYSDSLRDRLIELPFVRGPLSQAYLLALNGVALGN